MKRLQRELRERFSDASEMSGTSVHQLPYLSACIEETMRIMPPLTFGLPRESPGAEVDGNFVPKGVRNLIFEACAWLTDYDDSDCRFDQWLEYHSPARLLF